MAPEAERGEWEMGVAGEGDGQEILSSSGEKMSGGRHAVSTDT